MSVSEHPSRVERLLDRVRPSRRARGEAAEADGAQYLAALLSDPTPERAGARPYDTPGRGA